MDFNEKGFLGDRIEDFTVAVKKSYSKFFDLCSLTNELAHALKFELQIHNRDPQEFLAATIFLRLLNGFQAVAILAMKGLVFEAKVILRSILESLFILKLLCEDEAFPIEYLDSSKAQSLSWMNIAHESKDPNFDSLREYATKEVMAALHDECKKHGYKKLEVVAIATRAKLRSMYDTHYRLLSEQVHSLPISLTSFLVTDDADELSEFDWGPKDEDIDFVLFTNVQILLIAMVSVTALFEIDKTKEFSQIDNTLTALAPLLGKKLKKESPNSSTGKS